MKRIEDIKEFKDIDTYYGISEILNEVFQDRVEAHKHLVTANKEIERLNNIIKEVREYINHYETIRGYYEYEEDGYDEYNYEEDLKKEILEILDKEVNRL